MINSFLSGGKTGICVFVCIVDTNWNLSSKNAKLSTNGSEFQKIDTFVYSSHSYFHQLKVGALCNLVNFEVKLEDCEVKLGAFFKFNWVHFEVQRGAL